MYCFVSNLAWDPSQGPPPPGFHGTGPLPIDDPNSHDPSYPPPSIHDVRQFQGYEKVGGFGQCMRNTDFLNIDAKLEKENI